ncbi:hypothetical protein KUTeg_003519 [Tegillarca granosa]|uniref:Uncharacterized protein n=1 Tax=Tegillarca granosa TaxID=220873 RepID=A0ABQ9FME3_TEGGR|nr:hypothetical protein KUTeg_003519 [Tegillarca granosa]
MESSSLLTIDSQNPWSNTDTVIAPRRNVLLIAERTGCTYRTYGIHVSDFKELIMRDEADIQHLQEDIKEGMPSLKLISLLKKSTSIRKEHNRLNLEIQKRMQDKETGDITHIDVLEEKIKKISSLNAHIQSILDSKSQLLLRLQQPFVGDYIKLEAQYHRYASVVFPLIAPLLADLNTHLENISWTKSLSFSDGKMISILRGTDARVGAHGFTCWGNSRTVFEFIRCKGDNLSWARITRLMFSISLKEKKNSSYKQELLSLYIYIARDFCKLQDFGKSQQLTMEHKNKNSVNFLKEIMSLKKNSKILFARPEQYMKVYNYNVDKNCKHYRPPPAEQSSNRVAI